MFTAITFQDWTSKADKAKAVIETVQAYKGSTDFLYANTAYSYFIGDNTAVMQKVIATLDAVQDEEGKVIARDVQMIGNRVSSDYFFRFTTQQNQFLLGNGATLTGDAKKTNKKKLGKSFDTRLQQLGESALVQGVAFGYWNYDRLEILKAAVDHASGFCPLYDEETGELRAGIQFWQIADNKPVYYRVFEEDGVTRYVWNGNEQGTAAIKEPKRGYKQTVLKDAVSERVTDEQNYDKLPVIPLWGNTMKVSELTKNIKSKIDLYDFIMSDFGDNLERTNDVYWVLNNFGGSRDEVIQMLAEIKRLKATYIDSTNGQATAEPHTIEVPYEARKTAMELLEAALYSDYMALNMDEIAGGSLTNVAIKAATTNLNLKADRYEWCVRDFCDAVFALAGVDTEYSFKRSNISNDSEKVQDIYTSRADLTRRKALELNPYIEDDEIDALLADGDAESLTGQPSVDALQAQINAAQQ